MARIDEELEMPRFEAGLRIATVALLGSVLVGLAALMFYLITFAQDQRETNECYQAQIVALTNWAAVVSQAGRSDRQAQRELLLAQGEFAGGQSGALERYLRQLDEADQTRSAAPVPPLTCGRTAPMNGS